MLNNIRFRYAAYIFHVIWVNIKAAFEYDLYNDDDTDTHTNSDIEKSFHYNETTTEKRKSTTENTTEKVY